MLLSRLRGGTSLEKILTLILRYVGGEQLASSIPFNVTLSSYMQCYVLHVDKIRKKSWSKHKEEEVHMKNVVKDHQP